MRRHLGVAGILVLVAAREAQAQLPQIGVPRGELRIEIGGVFTTANARFFDGGEQPFAADWNADLGGAFLPAMAGADARIQAITGDASYRLSAGRSRIQASTSTGAAVVSASLGLTRGLTIFGTLPFVRARAQSRLDLDTTSADAGINPADPKFGTSGGLTQDNTFFSQLDAALANLGNKISSGFYTDPDTLALAQATFASGTALRAAMYGLVLDTLSASPFIPIATSTAGTAILGAVSGLQSTMTSLGVSGFSTDPALPTARLSESQFRDFITSPSGYVQTFYRGDEHLMMPGDAELGASYTVIDRPAFRVAATGLVRLPTGRLDRSDDFFDLGTGDGQTDVEGRIAADIAQGGFGARLSAGYNRQLAATVQRRVSAPSQPLAYLDRLAQVRKDPGDEVTLGVEPFVRLAPGFALALGAFHWTHGADVVGYVGNGVTGVAASELAIDSKRSATSLQAGLTYSSFAGIHGTGTPIEARWAFREVISATGGRVDKTRSLLFQFRAYYKLW